MTAPIEPVTGAGIATELERLSGVEDDLAERHRETSNEWVHVAASGAYYKAAEMVRALCGDGPTDLVLVPAAELARLRAIEAQSKATTAAIDSAYREIVVPYLRSGDGS